MTSNTQELTVQQAYDYGYECATKGANTTNCHYSIFESQRCTDAWLDGAEKAFLDMLVNNKKPTE